jgi:hypothetical protein
MHNSPFAASSQLAQPLPSNIFCVQAAVNKLCTSRAKPAEKPPSCTHFVRSARGQKNPIGKSAPLSPNHTQFHTRYFSTPKSAFLPLLPLRLYTVYTAPITIITRDMYKKVTT